MPPRPGIIMSKRMSRLQSASPSWKSTASVPLAGKDALAARPIAVRRGQPEREENGVVSGAVVLVIARFLWRAARSVGKASKCKM